MFEYLDSFYITAYGGFAIYIVLCTFFVTILAVAQTWYITRNLFKKEGGETNGKDD